VSETKALVTANERGCTQIQMHGFYLPSTVVSAFHLRASAFIRGFCFQEARLTPSAQKHLLIIY
jgi:hypothetical protein